MDANNIEQAVVLPLINPESWFYAVTTADVLRETRPHRDRLIPFCSIDPLSPESKAKIFSSNARRLLGL